MSAMEGIRVCVPNDEHGRQWLLNTLQTLSCLLGSQVSFVSHASTVAGAIVAILPAEATPDEHGVARLQFVVEVAIFFLGADSRSVATKQLDLLTPGAQWVLMSELEENPTELHLTPILPLPDRNIPGTFLNRFRHHQVVVPLQALHLPALVRRFFEQYASEIRSLVTRNGPYAPLLQQSQLDALDVKVSRAFEAASSFSSAGAGTPHLVNEYLTLLKVLKSDAHKIFLEFSRKPIVYRTSDQMRYQLWCLLMQTETAVSGLSRAIAMVICCVDMRNAPLLPCMPAGPSAPPSPTGEEQPPESPAMRQLEATRSAIFQHSPQTPAAPQGMDPAVDHSPPRLSSTPRDPDATPSYLHLPPYSVRRPCGLDSDESSDDDDSNEAVNGLCEPAPGALPVLEDLQPQPPNNGLAPPSDPVHIPHGPVDAQAQAPTDRRSGGSGTSPHDKRQRLSPVVRIALLEEEDVQRPPPDEGVAVAPPDPFLIPLGHLPAPAPPRCDALDFHFSAPPTPPSSLPDAPTAHEPAWVPACVSCTSRLVDFVSQYTPSMAWLQSIPLRVANFLLLPANTAGRPHYITEGVVALPPSVAPRPREPGRPLSQWDLVLQMPVESGQWDDVDVDVHSDDQSQPGAMGPVTDEED